MNGKSEKRQKKKKHSGKIYVRKNIIYKILLQKKIIFHNKLKVN